jgi:hypothetical protein
MRLSTPVLDEVDVAGGAVFADVAVARLVAVALDAAAPVVSVTELSVRTFQSGAPVVSSLKKVLKHCPGAVFTILNYLLNLRMGPKS